MTESIKDSAAGLAPALQEIFYTLHRYPELYVIDADACVDCGACAANCPTEAIVAE